MFLKEKIILKMEHWLACYLDPSTRTLSMLQGEERIAKVELMKAELQLRMRLLKRNEDGDGADTVSHSDKPPIAKKSKDDDIFGCFRSDGSAPVQEGLSSAQEVDAYAELSPLPGASLLEF